MEVLPKEGVVVVETILHDCPIPVIMDDSCFNRLLLVSGF